MLINIALESLFSLSRSKGKIKWLIQVSIGQHLRHKMIHISTHSSRTLRRLNILKMPQPPSSAFLEQNKSQLFLGNAQAKSNPQKAGASYCLYPNYLISNTQKSNIYQLTLYLNSLFKLLTPIDLMKMTYFDVVYILECLLYIQQS